MEKIKQIALEWYINGVNGHYDKLVKFMEDKQTEGQPEKTPEKPAESGAYYKKYKLNEARPDLPPCPGHKYKLYTSDTEICELCGSVNNFHPADRHGRREKSAFDR